MNKSLIVLTRSELEGEIKQAFIQGQDTAQAMQTGLDLRIEADDYVESRITEIIIKSKRI